MTQQCTDLKGDGCTYYFTATELINKLSVNVRFDDGSEDWTDYYTCTGEETESDHVNPEHKLVIAHVKSFYRAVRKDNTALLASKLTSLGDDLGKTTFAFLMSNRVKILLKSKNISITQFINLACLEKIERDNLL